MQVHHNVIDFQKQLPYNVIMDLGIFNPWWRTGIVPAGFVGRKRNIFYQAWDYISSRQMLIFTGLRRVGKTTLMYQIIDALIKKEHISPFRIFYFSFDESVENLSALVKSYEGDVLKKRIEETERLFLFFDEVHKLSEWQEKVKILYDLYPHIKIFLSGSLGLSMRKQARESLAGRFFEFVIKPLDFEEYLKFKDVTIDSEREFLFEFELKKYFVDFLKTGGFIEALGFEEEKKAKYFKESLLDRVIYRDIPESFSIDTPPLFYTLLKLLSSHVGLYLDYKNLGNRLKRDQRTIATYFSYLELAFLVQKLYNYSPNLLTSEKKIKRVYLSNSGFAYALNPQISLPLVLEQHFINLFGTKFFWRSPLKKEIDMILIKNDIPVPVEIKIREEITHSDLTSVFKFLRRYNLEKGYVITKNLNKTFTENTIMVIKAIPYWRYWTLRKEFF